jgi:hypothetical protein
MLLLTFSAEIVIPKRINFASKEVNSGKSSISRESHGNYEFFPGIEKIRENSSP